jgi:hypothetical protein
MRSRRSTAFPWALSRNRQELLEEDYIDLTDKFITPPKDASWDDPAINTSSTIRCTSQTMRGCFELGNIRNNNTYGLLLERWPRPTQMAEDFNDWTDTERSIKQDQQSYVPSDMCVRIEDYTT